MAAKTTQASGCQDFVRLVGVRDLVGGARRTGKPRSLARASAYAEKSERRKSSESSESSESTTKTVDRAPWVTATAHGGGRSTGRVRLGLAGTNLKGKGIGCMSDWMKLKVRWGA